MSKRNGDASPPKSTDLEGWRRAIAEHRLKDFRLEALVAAFQDIGHLDSHVQHDLVKHLSEAILRMLRRRVGNNKPNEGEDIILRAHGKIIDALLQPNSSDGKALRIAFGPRVEFRLKDVIAKEARERRTPASIAEEKQRKRKSANDDEAAAPVKEDAVAPSDKCDSEETGREGIVDGEDADQSHDTPDPKLDVLNEEIEVDRILATVLDPMKRMAFYLAMEGLPYKTKRNDVHSISEVLGVSEKTARIWVEEVRLLLAQNEEVNYLRTSKVGERS